MEVAAMIEGLHKGNFRFSGLSPASLSLPVQAADYVDRVAFRIGYGPGAVTPAIRQRIEGIVHTGLDVVKIAGIGRRAAIIDRDAERIFAPGLVIESAHWSRVVSRMSPGRQLACFVLTLGDGPDRLQSGFELFESFVLDGFGSELIEQTADRVERVLAEWFETRGLACTRRFSPGYCDWPLGAGQQAIFSFLNPADIDVSALTTGTMIPSKSISAVMIAAEKAPLATPCSFCPNKDCDHRRS